MRRQENFIFILMLMSPLCDAQVLANGLVSKGLLKEMLGEINGDFITKALEAKGTIAIVGRYNRY